VVGLKRPCFDEAASLGAKLEVFWPFVWGRLTRYVSIGLCHYHGFVAEIAVWILLLRCRAPSVQHWGKVTTSPLSSISGFRLERSLSKFLEASLESGLAGWKQVELLDQLDQEFFVGRLWCRSGLLKRIDT